MSSQEMFRKSKRPSTRRAEIQHLYQKYLSGETLSVSDLLKFLHKEQMELTADEHTAEGLINRYEIEESAIQAKSMTFEGFFRYMESKDCCVFNQAHTSVYQDMDQPLSSYFISSSHNTYLTGDQIVGKSHLDAYVIALRKGCRCLEIDCWDGSDMEPVVYHGYTLTNKILFKEVIATVEQHAFEVTSPYPVILSLENHCSKEQQEIMAHYLISILGEKLLRAPIDHPTTGELPNPHQKQKVVVAEALSDLVIYTRSVKFISFRYSRDNQHNYENTSLVETKARKLLKSPDFIRHNQRFLSRIYPAGSRTASSNYNPQEFWNVGCQLVALNFQSLATPMDLNDGRFQDNGGCGYILKPAVLMSTQGDFDPGRSRRSFRAKHLLLKVISGSNLPLSRSRKTLDPFVRVEIHGIPFDSCRKSTHAVKNNSLSPCWDAHMNFKIRTPELCLIRFCVRDQTGILSSEFVGQYTLPFTSLKKGEPHRHKRVREGACVCMWGGVCGRNSRQVINDIRGHGVIVLSVSTPSALLKVVSAPSHVWQPCFHLCPPTGYCWVPLCSRDGCSLDPASLFVLVWYS
uniref:Phosphoinositide phospholipase C n=1 Tax=Takifugu rubripes TaxID=31033 RepID=H2V313_TAKRU